MLFADRFASSWLVVVFTRFWFARLEATRVCVGRRSHGVPRTKSVDRLTVSTRKHACRMRRRDAAPARRTEDVSLNCVPTSVYTAFPPGSALSTCYRRNKMLLIVASALLSEAHLPSSWREITERDDELRAHVNLTRAGRLLVFRSLHRS